MCNLSAKAESLEARLFQAGIDVIVTFFRETYFAVRTYDAADIDHLISALSGMRVDYIEQEPGFPVIAYFHA